MQIAEKIIDWAWLNHLEQIARQAGEAIMGVYAKDFAHWNKADACQPGNRGGSAGGSTDSCCAGGNIS
jgi:hypothetical protein